MYVSASPISEEKGDWIHIDLGDEEWELFPTEAMALLRAMVRAMGSLTPVDIGECLSCGGQGFMLRDGLSDRYCIRCVSCARDTGWMSKEAAMEAWDRPDGYDELSDEGRDEP